ncbi:MAG TPA: type II restriction endonuclease [Candidatus Competibacteraceae bacterium]|nr:type II restriction endonuclease [Candidatus Competibacteraceae bacterium]HRY19410.1 type II restriction endonuclease [Candidatus Competibacteraceae bacterium]
MAKNFQFFVTEQWKIANNKGGSGNTANIGSINSIADIAGAGECSPNLASIGSTDTG